MMCFLETNNSHYNSNNQIQIIKHNNAIHPAIHADITYWLHDPFSVGSDWESVETVEADVLLGIETVESWIWFELRIFDNLAGRVVFCRFIIRGACGLDAR